MSWLFSRRSLAVLALGLCLPMMSIPAIAAPPDHVIQTIRFDIKVDEMKQQCAAVIAKAQREVDAIAAIPDKDRTFDNTIRALERMSTEVSDWLDPIGLLSSVSSDKAIQAAAGECEESISAFFSRTMVRPELYHAVTVAAQKQKLQGEDARLAEQTLKDFKRAGAGLTAEQRAEVTKLRDQLSHLETEFSRNYAQANDTVELTAAELAGMSPDYVGGLKKTAGGNYQLTLLDASQYIPFMENATSGAARRKVLAAKERVAAAVNVPLLEQAIALRTRIAKIMGYPSHAAFVLDNRMAKTPERVRVFLDGLATRLRPKQQAELAELLVLKKKDDAAATVVEAWDIPYYMNQLKKTRYAIDAEQVRAYFPVDHVLKNVFDIYQRLLGVRFTEIADGTPASAAVSDRWSKDVRLFEVHDAASNQKIGYFFLDLYPRPNKYKHFAAFTVRAGRVNADGSYEAPIAGIVGNFPAPRPGLPALLRHNEVETFFHEFGHVMHKVLTEAKYASLSGSHVRRDFVEAPSQMLENWVWNPVILKQLSSNYKSGQPMPDDLIKKLLATRHVGEGIFYSRQVMYATIDLDYHTSGEKVDTTAIWNKRRKEIALLEPLPGSQPQATFGHLMGGYDAGYYGYLWSKVFAEDMFTVFERDGLTSPKAGMKYRAWILAKGDTADPDVLLQGFLGRAPSSDAFYESLGLKK